MQRAHISPHADHGSVSSTFLPSFIFPNHISEESNNASFVDVCLICRYFLGHPHQFSRSVVSNSLRPHGPQHSRLPCPSPIPELAQTHVHLVVMPSNHLIFCHPLLLLPSIFPSIRIFPMSQFFTSGGQSIGASASASVLPMNIQD